MIPRIPEAEFNAYLDTLLAELSDNIRLSRIPIKEIARGARVKRDTVYAALKQRPIRIHSAARISYYIRQRMAAQAENKVNNEENANKRPVAPAENEYRAD